MGRRSGSGLLVRRLLGDGRLTDRGVAGLEVFGISGGGLGGLVAGVDGARSDGLLDGGQPVSEGGQEGQVGAGLGAGGCSGLLTRWRGGRRRCRRSGARRRW